MKKKESDALKKATKSPIKPKHGHFIGICNLMEAVTYLWKKVELTKNSLEVPLTKMMFFLT
jgi:hypothetical protein